MSKRYLIVHGHFYQPPRENPWILSIEPQQSAAPFHDWNYRITRECYSPNTQSRLLDNNGQIVRMINNYEFISFNMGPTLLSWLKQNEPVTYQRIIDADKKSSSARNGHGSAIAQVFNHIIMPLANERDKRTQIAWGIKDFKARFGREPEGMWLAETAVDMATLKELARHGIKFTILAQGQAQCIRPLNSKESWQDVSGGRIDPREPYRVIWGEGTDERIDVFFYDGPVSRAIAFEKLLSDGKNFLGRIEMAFGNVKEGGSPRLVNLATDGESYGHHFKFGDMALSWLINHINDSNGDENSIKLTNYGEYLSLYPPQKEVMIIENTSWSCAHGIERWRSDCGCNSGGGPEGKWNQKWRKPLRDALNRLRDEIAGIFERKAGELLVDPWLARDEYIEVVLADYDEKITDDFLARHQKPIGQLKAGDISMLMELLEAQLMSLYMFTSCAWFFDDISGLEPVQNLRYALRAIELCQDYTDVDLQGILDGFLKDITPNDVKYKSGLDLWNKKVETDQLTHDSLAAHWAAGEILENFDLLKYFKAYQFEVKERLSLTGDNIIAYSGLMKLTDMRLRKLYTKRCLALYSGGTHLAILVKEVDETKRQEATCLSHKQELFDCLGGEISSFATLNIWDAMLKIMPGSARFMMEDLLPYCRVALLSKMVDEIYSSIKSYTTEIFHIYQNILIMRRIADCPPNWVENFVFTVVAESEVKRILNPSNINKPVNITAFTSVLNEEGLLGMYKNEPVLAEMTSEYFRNSFSALKKIKPARRILLEISTLLDLIKRADLKLDLWEFQNDWYELKQSKTITESFTAEEAELLKAIGLSLGFAI